MAKFEQWITADALVLLEGWARDGLTDELIAGKMGIAVSTLYDWKKKHPEISDALKAGKHVVTANKVALAANGRMLQELAYKNQLMLRFESNFPQLPLPGLYSDCLPTLYLQEL